MMYLVLTQFGHYVTLGDKVCKARRLKQGGKRVLGTDSCGCYTIEKNGWHVMEYVISCGIGKHWMHLVKRVIWYVMMAPLKRFEKRIVKWSAFKIPCYFSDVCTKDW